MIKTIKANGTDELQFLKDLEARNVETDKKVTEVVSEIIDDVRRNGDEAVNKYTLKFDGSMPQYYEVPRDVINDALGEADEDFVNALLNAIENISDFHNRQKSQSFIDPKENGIILGQRVRGLARVGLYVPGGTAAYPSTVLMDSIPAKIAGVKQVVEIVKQAMEYSDRGIQLALNTLDYFDEMGLYAFSSGINLILIVTILICNWLVNKITGASLDKGSGG